MTHKLQTRRLFNDDDAELRMIVYVLCNHGNDFDDEQSVSEVGEKDQLLCFISSS